MDGLRDHTRRNSDGMIDAGETRIASLFSFCSPFGLAASHWNGEAACMALDALNI